MNRKLLYKIFKRIRTLKMIFFYSFVVFIAMFISLTLCLHREVQIKKCWLIPVDYVIFVQNLQVFHRANIKEAKHSLIKSLIK